MEQVAREYHYRVDGEGRIYHDGTEIVDPATLRFFLLALTRTPEGRWLAVCQGERNWFEPEGGLPGETPFIVQRLRLSVDEGRLRAVELCLAGDYREPPSGPRANTLLATRRSHDPHRPCVTGDRAG